MTKKPVSKSKSIKSDQNLRIQELERQLEIEAALERVRARTMAMHKSEDLEEVVGVLYEQVGLLELVDTGCNINIFNEAETTIESWMAGFDGLTLPRAYKIKGIHHPIIQKQWDFWQSKEDFLHLSPTGKEYTDFVKYIINETELSLIPEDFKAQMLAASEVKFFYANMKCGQIEIVNSVKITEETIAVVGRFAQVFEQTYTRFLDLQKAEAQAREAQIETALERVRATSMAMHKSKDLHKVINVVYHQLAGLGLTLHSTQISDNINDKHTLHLWLANNVQAYAEQVHVPITRNVFFTRLNTAIKNGESFFTLLLSKRQKDNFTRHVFENSKNIDSTKARQDFIYSLPGLAVSVAIGKSAILTVCRFDTTPYLPEENEIIKRFSKVFDQTYTRFLDLQKAEAQTREAQIEAALERVRAASMAMHRSEDLFDVVTLVFDQLSLQGIQMDTSMIIENHEDSKDWVVWAAAGGQNYSDQHRVPYLKHDLYDRLESARRKGLKFLEDSFTKAQKDEWFTQIFTNSTLVAVPSDRKKYIYEKEGLSRSVVLTKNVSFTFFRYSLQSFSSSENELFKRFAHVFEQSYARFLDLQTAEAQAREAQIEAALERVRAAGMAMHHTEELQTVIEVVCQQLSQLEIRMNTCTIGIKEENKKDHNYWGSTVTDQKIYTQKAHIPFIDHPIHTKVLEASKKGNVVLVDDYSMEETKEYMEHCFKQSYLDSMSKKQKQYILSSKGFARSVAFSKYSSISLINFHREKYSNDENEILKRFSKVFDQTYTRFLDLQKAEAQTREAQIEAALERVRAASMAMHNSNDLHKVIVAVYNQLEALGLKLNSTQIAVSIQDEKVMHLWNAANGQIYPKLIHLPFTRNIFFTRFRRALKNRESFYSVTTTKKQKDSLFRHYFNNSSHLDVPKSRQDSILSTSGMVFSVAVGKNIVLSVMRYNTTPFSNGENEIIIRIAKVFEQTYTRFLDLQKAEAQAREAQIEVALERVRAASMAMHHSIQIPEVVQVLLEQFEALQVTKYIQAYIAIFNLEDRTGEAYVSNLPGFSEVPYHFSYPLDSTTTISENIKQWQEGAPFLYHHYAGSQVLEWGKTLTATTGSDTIENYLVEQDIQLLTMIEASFEYGSMGISSASEFGENEKFILRRFAKVFEQTYTRFLDLQKAEAQTREAQIEAALERVRAASMAMHKTEEIADVVVILFKQLKELNLEFIASWIFVFHLEEGYYDTWISPMEGYNDLPINVKFPSALFEETSLNSWKEGNEFTSLSFANKEAVNEAFVGFDAATNTDFFTGIQDKFELESCEFTSATYANGDVSISTEHPPSEEYKGILKRFAKVFEQCYTRFLDLQKAEAQAREAQIEAALERVRAKAMAMHNSEDLAITVDTFFSELKTLNVLPRRCGVGIVDAETRLVDIHATTATEDDEVKKMTGNLTLKGHPVLENIYDNWIGQKEYHPVLRGKEISTYYKAMNPEVVFPDFADDVIQYGYYFFFKEGGVFAWTDKEFVESELQIFRRYTSVLSLTYRRFIDLLEAEAQAREAQIEAGLERVRARAMAMQRSTELPEVVSAMYEQLAPFGLAESGIELILCDEDTEELEFWSVSFQKVMPENHRIPKKIHPLFRKQWKAWKQQQNRLTVTHKGKEKQRFDDLIFSKTDFRKFPSAVQKSIRSTKADVFSHAIMKFGLLEAVDREPLSEGNFIILERFAKVFEQTYTRFLDLQKAEEQAIEAQIEAALERVRSRSMAMYDSEELGDVASLLYKELIDLGISNFFNCGFIIIKEEEGAQYGWLTQPEGAFEEKINLPYPGDHVIKNRIKAWKAKQPVFFQKVGGKTLARHLKYVADRSHSQHQVETFMPYMPDPTYFYCGNFSEGYLHIVTGEELGEEAEAILARFAKVFEQTYTRFLDLQKAEAQAREARIEAALEKVRSASMAMHKSDNLINVATIMHTEIKKLGMTESVSAGFALIDEEKEVQHLWSAQTNSKLLEFITLPLFGDQVFQDRYDAWKRKDPVFSTILDAQQLQKHLEVAMPDGQITDRERDSKSDLPESSFFYFGNFEQGYLQILSSEALSTHHQSILARFAKVFEQTYTRFLDLQKAEEQAREAQIEAALERIRSRSMAMHDSEELGDVASLLYKELIELGISNFFNCGFIIVKEEEGEQYGWLTQPEGNFEEKLNLPYPGDIVLKNRLKAWKAKEPVFFQKVGGKTLTRHLKYVADRSHSQHQVEKIMPFMPDPTYFYCGNFDHGYLHLITGEELGQEAEDILVRFSKVFNQTYTRFLDLQKAEAQAREAQIETALERVRSKTMAMHRSDELAETAAVLFKQLINLGIEPNRLYIGIAMNEISAIEYWLTDEDGSKISKRFTGYTNKSSTILKMYQGWKDQKKSLIIDMTGKELADHFQYLSEEMNIPFKGGLSQIRRVQTLAYFSQGFIGIATPEPEPDATGDLLDRFAGVFNLTYTRFLDLQNAEAQTREAQIEASLEKVRGTSMAMHKSEDLIHVANVMNQEFEKLGFINSLQASFVLIDEEKKVQYLWGAQTDSHLLEYVTLPLFGDDVLQKRYDAWKRKEAVLSVALTGEKRKMHLDVAMPLESLSERQKKGREAILDPFHICCGFIKYGYLTIISSDPLADDQQRILARMAKVFEQTYTRFLDLQKAEAQTREAQIETALERVRARAMAMHNSNELSGAAELLYSEFLKLGVKPFSIGYVINDEKAKQWKIWMTDANDEKFKDYWTLPFNADRHLKNRYDSWKRKDDFHFTLLEGKENIKHHEVIAKYAPWKEDSLKDLPHRLVLNSAHFLQGHLLIVTGDLLSAYEEKLLCRFAKVFEQTYTRFLDLKKAEERAQEAEIEASMERVRSRAMAMHRTKDLNEVIAVIFEELKHLGFETSLCSIGIYNSETKGADWWSYIEGHDIPGAYHFPYLEGRWFREIYQAWADQKPFHYIELVGAEYEEQLKLTFEKTQWKNLPKKIKNTLKGLDTDGIKATYVSMTRGMLEILTDGPLKTDQIEVLQRFTKVIDLTYTRVDDLEQAEAREKEATQQASLDRIRGEISSMRDTEDLMRITPLIWKELNVVDIPFFRCGIFIMDEEVEAVQVFLANAYGEALTTLNLSFGSAANIDLMVDHWRNQKNYIDSWDQKQYISFFTSMMEQGHMSYQEMLENPPEQLHLQFVPFKQGMLYIGSLEKLNDEQLDIVGAMAQTFQSAYNRYEDFRKIEFAKIEVEKTLGDLKSTQNQLIHAEKMASLGELTAGIAHEIQNPLNFVNNFSDVSGEMIDEAFEELDSNDVDEAKDILKDLKGNLEKIAHHGRRASSIVKGMLDHSRTDNSQKVETDINALCDEYLRLSYHGLRAKDNSFNSAYEMNFDESLPKIKVIPQELGRVLLNILNNAFYACSARSAGTGADRSVSTEELGARGEKGNDANAQPTDVSVSTKNLTPKENPSREEYKPVVTLTTKQLNDWTIITISDNGIGMSQETIDKVFQPFFTTKPTGSGTGLGMSISYDIITKGHGGELKVESKEGEGTTFIIELPDSN